MYPPPLLKQPANNRRFRYDDEISFHWDFDSSFVESGLSRYVLYVSPSDDPGPDNAVARKTKILTGGDTDDRQLHTSAGGLWLEPDRQYFARVCFDVPRRYREQAGGRWLNSDVVSFFVSRDGYKAPDLETSPMITLDPGSVLSNVYQNNSTPVVVKAIFTNTTNRPIDLLGPSKNAPNGWFGFMLVRVELPNEQGKVTIWPNLQSAINFGKFTEVVETVQPGSSVPMTLRWDKYTATMGPAQPGEYEITFVVVMDRNGPYPVKQDCPVRLIYQDIPS